MTTTHIPAKDVAKMIRTMLRREFGRAVKFSVRTDVYAGGSSIRVRWTDGPTKSAVEAVIGHMHGATFDGMTDMKNYHHTVLDGGREVSLGNDYLTLSRDLSDEAEDMIWDEIAAHTPGWTVGARSVQQSEHMEGDEAFNVHAPTDPATGKPVEVGVGVLNYAWNRRAVVREYAACMDLSGVRAAA